MSIGDPGERRLFINTQERPMPVISNYPHGVFSCPCLCSENASAAKAFYTGLLGWEPVALQIDDKNPTVFKVRGENVAAMYQMGADRKSAGVVPHWNNYIVVRDAADVARRTPELGGKVLTPPFDAMGGIMANLEDPYGAKFSVWQAVEPPQPSLTMETGALCWSELYTPDMQGAERFYSELLGWRFGAFEASPLPYSMFTPQEMQNPIGGVAKLTPEMAGMRPQWIPYFNVADADASMAKAAELGAKVNGPIDIPDVGRLAIVVDPEGAMFAFIGLRCEEMAEAK
jgi:predicted enzyme related to lactoylglutathione lyase